MLIGGLVWVVLSLILSVIGIVPDTMASNDVFDISSLMSMISTAFVVFPADLFLLCVTNITFWLTVQWGWSVLEWFYKKIPGVS